MYGVGVPPLIHFSFLGNNFLSFSEVAAVYGGAYAQCIGLAVSNTAGSTKKGIVASSVYSIVAVSVCILLGNINKLLTDLLVSLFCTL